MSGPQHAIDLGCFLRYRLDISSSYKDMYGAAKFLCCRYCAEQAVVQDAVPLLENRQ